MDSDDHASLEVTFDKDGNVVSGRSAIALQGKKETCDLIEGSGKMGSKLVGMDLAAKVGTEMISSHSAKILRENSKEPGKVSFPAGLQHPDNILCLAVKIPEEEGQMQESDAAAENEEGKVVPLKIEASKK